MTTTADDILIELSYDPLYGTDYDAMNHAKQALYQAILALPEMQDVPLLNISQNKEKVVNQNQLRQQLRTALAGFFRSTK